MDINFALSLRTHTLNMNLLSVFLGMYIYFLNEVSKYLVTQNNNPVGNISGSCCPQCWNHRFKWQLFTCLAYKLYCAFVLHILDYCDIVWIGYHHLCNILNIWRGFIQSLIVHHLALCVWLWQNKDGFMQQYKWI